MSQYDGAVSRRRLLQATGAVGTLGIVGTAAGEEDDADDYIVGTSSHEGRREAERRAEEVRHVHDFGDIGQAVAGRYSEGNRRDLRRRNDVRYVEKDTEMQALGHTTDESSGDPSLEQVLPWGIDRVDAEIAHHDGETGSGSSISIIDTGIDPEHETVTVSGGAAFVDCVGLDCSSDWDDDHGHGTHCAGTADGDDNGVGVVGTSTAADLYAVKVLDATGSGFTSDVAAGIEWTADQGIDVGSLSLGGGDSSTLEDACRYAHSKGTLLVAAAGNDGPCEDCVGYPAAYDECIAVSATDDTDDLADFSSTGPEVELAAPGVDVLSSLPGDDYDSWDGTSMACPHVSGAGAQLMEHGDTNEQARSTLAETAEDIGLAANEQGNGLLDVAAALGLDSSDDGDDGDGSDGGDDGSGSTAPSIDTFDLRDHSNRQWARVRVDWAVSDADGDLDSVTTELRLDGDSEVLDSATSSVSGADASGTHDLRNRDGHGTTYEVTLTVVDAGGNEATQSDTIEL